MGSFSRTAAVKFHKMTIICRHIQALTFLGFGEGVSSSMFLQKVPGKNLFLSSLFASRGLLEVFSLPCFVRNMSLVSAFIDTAKFSLTVYIQCLHSLRHVFLVYVQCSCFLWLSIRSPWISYTSLTLSYVIIFAVMLLSFKVF